MQKCSGLFCRKQSVENSFESTVQQLETCKVNLVSKDSRKKKKSGFSGDAEWMKDEECFCDVEEEAKEGRKEGREKLQQMKRCGLHGSHSHLCVGAPPGQDGPSAAFGVEV